jgi:isochorismate hydrolase
VIVGVSTNNSVEAMVVADACFTFDKRDFGGTLRSAEEVHLMALANLDGEYAEVLSTDELIRQIGG